MDEYKPEFVKEMKEIISGKHERIPDNMTLLEYISSLPDDEDDPEFVEEVIKSSKEKPIFKGTLEEFDKFLDTLE